MFNSVSQIQTIWYIRVNIILVLRKQFLNFNALVFKNSLKSIISSLSWEKPYFKIVYRVNTIYDSHRTKSFKSFITKKYSRVWNRVNNVNLQHTAGIYFYQSPNILEDHQPYSIAWINIFMWNNIAKYKRLEIVVNNTQLCFAFKTNRIHEPVSCS